MQRTHPLNEAQRHQLGRRDAVFQIFKECFTVKRVKLVEVAEEDVGVALKSRGHNRRHLFRQQLVSVAL